MPLPSDSHREQPTLSVSLSDPCTTILGPTHPGARARGYLESKKVAESQSFPFGRHVAPQAWQSRKAQRRDHPTRPSRNGRRRDRSTPAGECEVTWHWSDGWGPTWGDCLPWWSRVWWAEARQARMAVPISFFPTRTPSTVLIVVYYHTWVLVIRLTPGVILFLYLFKTSITLF